MKNLILYGLSTAFNRGGMFLILPVLAFFLSIVDYGNLTLYLIFVQLLVPLISLNFSSIVARDYYEKRETVKYLLGVFNFIFIFIFIFLLFLNVFFINDSAIFLVVILLISEAIFVVNSTFCRFDASVIRFFWLNFAKIFTLGMVLIFTYYLNAVLLSNIFFILYTFIFSNVISLSLYRLNLVFNLNTGFSVFRSNFGLFLFSLGLIPHILSQWVTSSSDRFFVKILGGDVSLGYYSFAYSLASVYMIMNSALALAIPQLCVKDFNYFSSKDFSKKYFFIVSTFWLFFLIFFYFLVILFDWKYSKLIVLRIGYFVLVGFYFLSYYYYYSSFLFYKRKVKILSYISIFIAILNAILVLVLTYFYGILGTAIATFISYFVYSYSAYYFVKKKYSVRGLYMPIFLVVVVSLFLYFFDILFLYKLV